MNSRTLPHRDKDPVLTLYNHYFLTADLMRKNFSKLKEKQVSRGYLSQNDSVDETIYFITWLGFLAVTCEGFKNLNFRILLSSNRPKEFEELIPYSDEIGRKIKIHSDSLRKLRNDVFHLRKDTNTFESFLSEKGGRVQWSEKLHDRISKFFSEYRILCEFHYIVNNRSSESQILKKSKPASEH